MSPSQKSSKGPKGDAKNVLQRFEEMRGNGGVLGAGFPVGEADQLAIDRVPDAPVLRDEINYGSPSGLFSDLKAPASASSGFPVSDGGVDNLVCE